MVADLKDFFLGTILPRYEYIRIPVALLSQRIIDYYNLAPLDALRLLDTLRTCGYRVTEDWTGSRYVGINLEWDYEHRTVDLSMPGYIERALLRFQHPTPLQPEDPPRPWQKPQYGAKIQYTSAHDSTPALDATQTNHLQQVIGVLLYYARAIDCTMLPALGTLATDQAAPTAHTLENLTQLLNYCATHSDATVRLLPAT